MDKKDYVLGLLLTALVEITALSVQEGNAMTIMCPLEGNYRYPMWTGPDTLAKPFMTGNSFNEQGITWADNNVQDIRITGAVLKHDGTYTCTDDQARTASVDLNVEYFKSPTIDIVSDSNSGRTTLTCGAHSNPPSPQINVRLDNTINPNVENSTAKITLNGCQQMPNMDNRTYCSVTAVWYMWKVDNGKTQSCTFIYKGETQTTHGKKVYFNFPPTSVKITGNKPITEGTTLNLTCSTDSSYPVSSLEWRKGTKTNIKENSVINNNALPIVTDAEYNGKSISQNLDLAVTNDMDGQRISCCVDDLCDSVKLAFSASAAGKIVTPWISLLIACMVFVLY